jgi:hypothetical protein
VEKPGKKPPQTSLGVPLSFNVKTSRQRFEPIFGFFELCFGLLFKFYVGFL